MSLKVAVIGSGLSAIGAIKALRARGIRPTVIDRGRRIDSERSTLIKVMASMPPAQWTENKRVDLFGNASINNGTSIPKKMFFGSDFFYGKSLKDAPVISTGTSPPFSYALGGMSCGWGAAILPAQACDLGDWPVSAEELNSYYVKVMADLPYSAKDDGLSLNFPLLKSSTEALKLGEADSWLLDKLQHSVKLKKGETVFGQSRLLVDATTNDSGCKYCGQCMSGCVYDAIYKSGDEILKLEAKEYIEYLPGNLVERLDEECGKVLVTYQDEDGIRHIMKFDRVFVAAGAVNSARIVLNSLGIFDRVLKLSSRGGFVIPMISLRRIPNEWPNRNTQPGLFMEINGKGLENWVHIQISTENELLLQKLGIGVNIKSLVDRLKRLIASHIVVLFVNYHSDNAGSYSLWLEKAKNREAANRLHSVHHKLFPQFRVWLLSWMRLFLVFSRIGLFPLFPFARLNSSAYHVGGTLPMRETPSSEVETDTLGRISKWKGVHIVDSATFPSLPGTTIGLLTMANAYRIVDKLDW
jgi:choline dehydrogenase-like flavoprotein